MTKKIPDHDSLDTSADPAVSVVVVNYNGQEHLAECIAALCTDTNVPVREIVVVDNASTDGSVAIAEEYAARQPALRVLKSTINRGYAAGVNLALPETRGKYMAVLNMDTIVTPGWLQDPIAFLEAQPEVGAVSPMLVLDQDPHTVNAIGQEVHVTALGFNRGLGQSLSDAGREPLRVSGIHGGAFIIRRAILDRIGGLEESGFLYHEDVDISWLLQLMGYDLYCVPTSIVRHKYFLTMYAEKLYLLERNRVAMLLAHLERRSLLLLAPLILFTEGLMWGYCLLRGTAFLKAKAASYGWVLGQRKSIAARKAFVDTLRRRSDWQVLGRLPWDYAWDQFLTLGRERGPSQRQPAGGLPVKMTGAT